MKKEKREYPRQVWVLTPSYKPTEVTVVQRYAAWSNHDYGDQTDKGKLYHMAHMHASKSAAIAAGREAIKKVQADINKRQENLNKRVAALDKSEGK